MYSIELSPSALKDLRRLVKSNKKMADRIVYVIENLGLDPYLGKRLTGDLRDLMSLRAGDYRILYCVIKERILIQIIKIAHRRDVYRK